MATIGRVSAVFTSSTSGLRTGVGQAVSSMQRLERQMASVRTATSALAAISGVQFFGQIAGTAMGYARSLVNVAQQQAEVIDKASKMAARLGVTYSELAGLQHAGDLAGVSIEQIGGAMTRADVALVKAANGSKQAQERFAALGLSVDQLQAMSPAERFNAIASAISALPDPAQRAAAAVGLFGRAGAELLPLFADGRGGIAAATEEARKFGLALTNAQGRDVEAMNDSFTKVYKAITGIIQQVVAQLAPSITNITTKFTDMVGSIGGTSIGKWIADGLIVGAKYLAGVGDYLIKGIPAAWAYVQKLASYWSGVFEVGQRVFSYVAAIAREWEAAFKFVGSILTGTLGRVLNAIGELAQFVPGLGTFGKDTEKVGEGLMATSRALWEEAGQALIATGENMANAMFGPGTVGRAGEQLAGPLTTALEAGLAQAQASASALDSIPQKPLEVNAAPVAQAVAAAVDNSVNKSAVEGIDSRSAEGLKTMFRIMRGDTGNDVQQQQLDVQKDIRRELQQQNENQPDMEFDVFDLAPAAGA